MLILGVETSTSQVSCAIGGHEGVLGASQAKRGQRHAEVLVPMIADLCRTVDVALAGIGVVAVGVGPGLYTGLRVGVATAKALALALRTPMIGVPSLDLLAFPVRYTSRLIVTAMDARRGELFVASYRATPGGIQQLGPPRVSTPAELASELEVVDGDCLLVGDGALRYADLFESARRVEIAEGAQSYPSAWALVQLAHAQALREEFVVPAQLRPIYLRRPDAEANWAQRPAGVAGDRR